MVRDVQLNMVMLKIDAMAVPGRKIIVRIAMVRIAALSCMVKVAMLCELSAISSWVWAMARLVV